MAAPPKKKPLAELEREVERLLAAPLSDAELLGALERLAGEDPRLGVLSYRYGPVLYRRNRAHFRPFLRAHFQTSVWDPPKLHQIKYQDNAKALDEWLTAVDQADDLELFPILFSFKHGYRPEAFQAELKKQYEACAAPVPAVTPEDKKLADETYERVIIKEEGADGIDADDLAVVRENHRNLYVHEKTTYEYSAAPKDGRRTITMSGLFWAVGGGEFKADESATLTFEGEKLVEIR